MASISLCPASLCIILIHVELAEALEMCSFVCSTYIIDRCERGTAKSICSGTMAKRNRYDHVQAKLIIDVVVIHNSGKI